MATPQFLIALHIIMMIVTLLMLRRLNLEETPRVLWAILMTAVPILGPLAFVIVAPGRRPE